MATSSFLSQAVTGKTARPRRIMLYGPHGIGKNTWADGAPNPVLIQTEPDGADDVGTTRLSLCTDLNREFFAQLREIGEGDHDFKTLIIDSADWLERIIWKQVAIDKQADSIADIEFGKGYDAALIQWRQVLAYLDYIMRHRSMHIIFLAHSRVQTFNDPNTEPYDRYTPALHINTKGVGAGALVQQWCDEVLLAIYKVYAKTTDNGFGRTRTRGESSGERVIYTEERPGYNAKNRLGLPHELEMPKVGGWKEFSKHFLNADPHEETLKTVAGQVEELEPEPETQPEPEPETATA